MFNNNGGDGFYGGLALNTDETVMVNKPFYGSYIPSDYKLFKDKFNDTSLVYPIAKYLQPLLIKFKTGYRDINKAKKAVNALVKTIKKSPAEKILIC